MLAPAKEFPMPNLLVYVLAGAIVALTVALLPLLQQLARTAASAERFLDSAKDDLRRVQEDVRAARERIDMLAGSAQGAVDQLHGLSTHLAELGTGLKGSVDGLLSRMGGGGGGGFNMGGFLGILSTIIALLRRPKTA
jgi:hypothetical protein